MRCTRGSGGPEGSPSSKMFRVAVTGLSIFRPSTNGTAGSLVPNGNGTVGM